jgi:diacylglycerol kinase (ATP)
MVPPSQGRSWVGIVANQNSGIGRARQRVTQLMLALAHAGLHGEVAWTTEDRTKLVRRAEVDPACQCLVAVGGDGTVSALLNERPNVPVSVFPAGTENLVAQQFGLRRDPHALARIIAHGQPRRVDLGSAGGRRFLLMVGFGFDGDIVSRHHRARLSRLGRIRPTSRLAYVLPVLRSSFSYTFPTINVRIENQGVPEVLSGTTVFIFNAPRYALGLPFVPAARDDDGWLDVLIFRDPGPFKALYYLWKVLWGTHLNLPSVFHRRVKSALVTADGTVPVQIDGDPGGYLQKTADAPPADGTADRWTVEIVPQAIEVYAPKPTQANAHR